jgi:hypothetical protein
MMPRLLNTDTTYVPVIDEAPNYSLKTTERLRPYANRRGSAYNDWLHKTNIQINGRKKQYMALNQDD